MKDFEMHELRAALRFAAAGGQALHYHPFSGIGKVAPFREAGKKVAHLFDFDSGRLRSTAIGLGVFQFFIHRRDTPYQHLDITGKPLMMASRMCPTERLRGDEVKLWNDDHGLTPDGIARCHVMKTLVRRRSLWTVPHPDSFWYPPEFTPVNPGPDGKAWVWTAKGHHFGQEGEVSILPHRLLREIEAVPLPKVRRRLPPQFETRDNPGGLIGVGFRTRADADTALALALSAMPLSVSRAYLNEFADPEDDGTAMTAEAYSAAVRKAFLRDPSPKELEGAGYTLTQGAEA